MTQAGKYLREFDGGYNHWCPACQQLHYIQTDKDEKPRWDFNGDLEKPTFTPSVRIKTGHYANGDKEFCWCTYEQRFGKPAHYHCYHCHYNITEGKIVFHGDCSHEFKGQTLPLQKLSDQD